MQRRDFLKGAGAAALLLSVPVPFARRAFAQGRPDYFYFMIDAHGAWDTTSSIDPKGDAVFSSHYNAADIRQTSTGIRYAPMNGSGADYMSGPEGSRTPFFERYKDDLVILNGLDTKTNSHDVGPRHVWSGSLRVGNPNFGGLMAAIKERDLGNPLPLAMVSTGGFDSTANLLPVARTANPAILRNATVPALANANNPNARFLHADTDAIIKAAERERRGRQDVERFMPAVKRAMQQHWSMRDVEAAFGSLNTEIAGLPALSDAEGDNRLIVGAQLAIAGMLSGSCVAAMLSLTSFDTHANHDALQRPKQQELFDAVDYVVRMTRQVGIYDRSVIIVGSDFGRTVFNGPAGDNTRGKDHWPITSMMALGGPINGGRTIGETDLGPMEPGAAANLKGQRSMPQAVRGGVLETVGAAGDDVGLILNPAHVQQALRSLAQVEGDPITDKFPLELENAPLPLFS